MTQPIYEVIEHELFGKSLRKINADGSVSSIPMDEANSDYQAYLNPVEHSTEILPN